MLQARTRVHWVMDDAVRDRLVDNFVRQLLNSVRKPVRQREFGYWRNVDMDLGDRNLIAPHRPWG
jgi:catalase